MSSTHHPVPPPPHPTSWVCPTWCLTIGPWKVASYSQKQQEKCHETGSVHCGKSQSICFWAGLWNRTTGGRKAIRPPEAKGGKPQEARLKVWKDLELCVKDQRKEAVKPALAYGTTWGGPIVNPIKSYIEANVRMAEMGRTGAPMTLTQKLWQDEQRGQNQVTA